jgi:hypothetical protein
MTRPACKKEVDSFHEKSHVIPDWMSTECYDEKHRLIIVTVKEEKADVKQSSLYGVF